MKIALGFIEVLVEGTKEIDEALLMRMPSLASKGGSSTLTPIAKALIVPEKLRMHT